MEDLKVARRSSGSRVEMVLSAAAEGEPSGDEEGGVVTGWARDWIAVPVWERRRVMSWSQVSKSEKGGGMWGMYGVDVG
jgi:hypothetical protein